MVNAVKCIVAAMSLSCVLFAQDIPTPRFALEVTRGSEPPQDDTARIAILRAQVRALPLPADPPDRMKVLQPEDLPQWRLDSAMKSESQSLLGMLGAFEKTVSGRMTLEEYLKEAW